MSDEFTLTIRLGNDAMQTTSDVAEVLRSAAADLESGRVAAPVLDINGNHVGSWEFAL